MKTQQYDAHVVAHLSRKAVAEAEAMGEVAKALEGLNSDQVRRVINAAAAMNDLDIRIPVPKLSGVIRGINSCADPVQHITCRCKTRGYYP